MSLGSGRGLMAVTTSNRNEKASGGGASRGLFGLAALALPSLLVTIGLTEPRVRRPRLLRGRTRGEGVPVAAELERGAAHRLRGDERRSHIGAGAAAPSRVEVLDA